MDTTTKILVIIKSIYNQVGAFFMPKIIVKMEEKPWEKLY
jgi:hypothetical protein